MIIVPVLALGVLGIGVIAVRLFHLLVVDVAHLHLRFGRLGSVGEEGDEVLVFGLGLRQRRRAALLEPAIAHRQFGAHPVLGVRIGIEHGLQVEPRHVEAALLHSQHRLVEEFLVGLFGVHAGQRVGAQVLVLLVLGLFLLGLGRNPAQHQSRQSHRGNLQRQPVHTTSLRRRPARPPAELFPQLLLNFTRLLRADLPRGLACRRKQLARIPLRLPGAKDRIPGHQQFRSCLDDACHRIVSHAAVYFDSKCQPQFLAQLGQPPDLIQREFDKLLPAKAGIHAHDQHVMHHGQNVREQFDARRRVQHHPRLHSMLRNQFQRAVQMPAGLVVHAHPVGPRIGKGGYELVRVLDHQVAIERQACPAQALHHRRTKGDVGHKMSVHHVHVDHRAAAPLEAAPPGPPDGQSPQIIWKAKVQSY